MPTMVLIVIAGKRWRVKTRRKQREKRKTTHGIRNKHAEVIDIAYRANTNGSYWKTIDSWNSRHMNEPPFTVKYSSGVQFFQAPFSGLAYSYLILFTVCDYDYGLRLMRTGMFCDMACW